MAREPATPDEAFRPLTIVAQDPGFRDPDTGRIVTARVDIPSERLGKGPWGYRVHVVDYDVSTGTYHEPHDYGGGPTPQDPWASGRGPSERRVLRDRRFHQQNVYAIAMRTLARFEMALGRRVDWAFPGHQLKIAPHAFSGANAFYSRDDNGLMFGYFQGRENTIYTCLSHDVVAHETTHAVLDGLRRRYLDASSHDQAGFHEGFADVVSLLSIYSIPEVVSAILRPLARRDGKLRRGQLREKDLIESALFKLADEMGSELSGIRGEALRHSSTLPMSDRWKSAPEYREPHRRGEVLVAALMRSFVRAWRRRLLEGLGRGVAIDVNRVIEAAAETADTLLTMAIRALDYSPPIHITYDDYLAALLTADKELRPDDAPEDYRRIVTETFARFGIRSPARNPDGSWDREDESALSYERVHYEPLQSDPNELFRFVWENRGVLRMSPAADTQVESVRPARRHAADGFVLTETVAEAVQFLRLTTEELRSLCVAQSKERGSAGIRERLAVLDEFEPGFVHELKGGSTLLLDDFGHLKYSIGTRVDNGLAQLGRIESLLEHGAYVRPRDPGRQFAELHERRSLEGSGHLGEQW